MGTQSGSEKSIDVPVIIPALNEEHMIRECIKKIQKVLHENEMNGEIIVADSSSDQTSEIAASLRAPIIKPEKSGYGTVFSLDSATQEVVSLLWVRLTTPMIFMRSQIN